MPEPLRSNNKKKTAILLRCTQDEAEMIRRAATLERRTLSGFILNAVMNRLRARADIARMGNAGVPPPLRRKDDVR